MYNVAWLCLHKYSALCPYCCLWLCGCTTIIILCAYSTDSSCYRNAVLLHCIAGASVQIEPRLLFALHSAATRRSSALQRELCNYTVPFTCTVHVGGDIDNLHAMVLALACRITVLLFSKVFLLFLEICDHKLTRVMHWHHSIVALQCYLLSIIPILTDLPHGMTHSHLCEVLTFTARVYRSFQPMLCTRSPYFYHMYEQLGTNSFDKTALTNRNGENDLKILTGLNRFCDTCYIHKVKYSISSKSHCTLNYRRPRNDAAQ